MKKPSFIFSSKSMFWVCAFLVLQAIGGVKGYGQIITTFAGNGTVGGGTDGIPATAAGIGYPLGIVNDKLGNFYIVFNYEKAILKVSNIGIVTTIAGTGGSTGEGIAATTASLPSPISVVVDKIGNVYCTGNNYEIRKIDTFGIITTLAGGTGGYSGDGGQASASAFSTTAGIAIDTAGNIFVADINNQCIRKISSFGIITTVVGIGSYGFTGNGGQATLATLHNPNDVKLDALGNMYIADQLNHCVRKVTTAGIISTVAGIGGTSGFTGDGSAATLAKLNNPTSIAIDKYNNLYICDYGNSRVRKVDATGIITTVAGTGTNGYNGIGGNATATQLNAASYIAVDASNNLYISDNGNHRVCKIPYGNHKPSFIGGHNQTFSVCKNSSYYPINSLLTVSDSDMYQNETWSVLSSPLHGTLVVNFNTLSTGGVLTPSNLFYTPTPAFAGTDTFKLRVFDGYTYDTTNIYVNVGAATINNTITGSSIVCNTTTLIDTANAGIWSSSNNVYATINTSGVVTGIKIGIDTIFYTNTYSCGGYTATKIITVNTETVGSITGGGGVCVGSTMVLNDAITGGVWSSINPTIASINTAGVVTGVAAGTATISYTISNSCNTVAATAIITVVISPTISTSIIGSDVISVGYPLSYTEGTAGGIWSSSNSAFATINSLGVAIGVSIGATVLQYTITNACGSVISSKVITVSSTTSPSGIFSTIAGTGVAGYSGDGAVATAAKISMPGTIVRDTAGNFYFTDDNNNRVRKINTSGTISTIAGTGTAGYGGDGGSSTAGVLYTPTGLALDDTGNLYIADQYNHRIRKINRSGLISTIAGTGTAGFSGDGSAAIAAKLSYPVAVSTDHAGNVYIVDNGNQRIRKINSSGIISTIVGTGTVGYSGDGGHGTAANLNYPGGVVMDNSGNLYITDYSNHVRKLNSSGIISTIAGSSTAGFSGDGGLATAALLHQPTGIVLDNSGNIYIGDLQNNRIRKINTSGIISTVAGNGIAGYSGDGGFATAAEINGVNGLYVDNMGYLYLPDAYNNRIRKIGVTAITGLTNVCVGSSITLSNVTSGGIWSSSNSTISTIGATTGVVTGINAGTDTITYTLGSSYTTYIITVNALPNAGIITGAASVCVHSTVAVILSDTVIGGLWSSHYTDAANINSSGIVIGVAEGSTVISYTVTNNGCTSTTTKTISVYSIPSTTITGSSIISVGYTLYFNDASSDGNWISSNSSVASINSSGAITGIAAGNSIISYSVNNVCGSYLSTKSITVNTLLPNPVGIINTIAGTGVAGFSGDGGAASLATLNHPQSIVPDGKGNFYVCDYGNNRIRKINSLGIITTIAGTGTGSFSGDGGQASAATFLGPNYVGIDKIGNLYVADGGNNRIRKIDTFGIIKTIAGNGSANFSGDGGQATAATMRAPAGICIDTAGTVYFADVSNSRVRKIATTGIITTIAGTGTFSFSGDGGQATAANLNLPEDVKMDVAGNIYISDGENFNVRKITTSGIISTIAGNTFGGFSGDGGMATAATIAPMGIVLDKNNNLYISDCYNFCIRKRNTSGIITTIAGIGGVYGYSGDGGNATAAKLFEQFFISLDTSNNMYIADTRNNCIRKVSYSSNHAPKFTGGHTQSFTTCQNTSAFAINSLLAVIDSDMGQTDTWSSVSAPAHGTLIAAYSTTSTGNVLSPTGLSYTPNTSYAGYDTFKIRVTDGTASDTITLYAIITASSVNNVITGANNVCVGTALTLTDTLTGGTWSSSNITKATVNTSGIVTGVSVGTDTISYSKTYSCGTNVAKFPITVNTIVAGTITGIAILCEGFNTTLSNTTTGGIWSSSNTAVATVNSSGVVSGASSGNATISYTVSNTCGSTSSTANITVNAIPASISGSGSVTVGSTLSLTDITTGGTWSSNNTSIATINSLGIVTGVNTGTAIISYLNSSGCFVTTSITVNSLTLPAITGASTVCAGATTAFSNTTTGGTWSSSNTSIANVGTSSGIVAGVAAGSATITYTVSGSIAIKTITVNPLPNAGTISGIAAICPSTTLSLTDATSGGTWSSVTTSIATINSSGLVSGLAVGTTVISYSLTNSCGLSAATAIITVNPLPTTPASITGSNTVCMGRTTTLNDATTGGAWTCSNTAIVSVTSTGVVTGVSAGSARITYTSSTTCGSLYATATITVNNTPSAILGTNSVCAGNTVSLTDSVTGGTWSTSNSGFAPITTGGIVSGNIAGTATISYTIGSCVATLPITINAVPNTITGSGAACIGSTVSLGETTTGGSWSSNNTALATVTSTGVVTAIAVGSPVITYSLGGCYKTTVETINTSPATISGSNTVCVGSMSTLSNTVTGGTWSTSNSGFAPITIGGVVSGSIAGTATISYTIGSCVATLPITINAVPASITGSGAACIGSTVSLGETTIGGSWSSSNTALATVTSTGVLTAIAAGSPIITYSLGGCYKTTVETINASPATISGSNTVCVGSMSTLSNTVTGGTWSTSNSGFAPISTGGVVSGNIAGAATISYSIGTCVATLPITINAVPNAIGGAIALCGGNSVSLTETTTGGSWSSSNTALATVTTTGVVTGVATGNPVITYSLGGCYKTVTETINASPAAISGTSAVCLGNNTTLTNTVSGGTWSTSNSGFAPITTSGVVSGNSIGTAIISYSIGSCVATLPITINTNTIPAITGTATVCVGSNLTVADATAGGTWSINNTSLATIDASSGLVTGVSAGTPIISYSLSGCYKTAIIPVNGTYPGAISGANAICVGSSATLTDTSASGTWSSTNTAAAGVNSTGLVTGSSAGTTSIVYTKNACSVSYPVTINANTITSIYGSPLGGVCLGNTITMQDATVGGTWTINDASIATINASTGVLNGLSAGLTSVTYTIGGCYKALAVGVGTSVAAISGANSICTSTPTTLTDATTGGNWYSSATAKATVATGGIVTGVAAGTATISYVRYGCVALYPVTVNVCREGSSITNTTNATQIDYTLFPNPSTGLINIEQSQPSDLITEVRVMNYVGQTVFAGSIEFTGGKSQISLANVVPGIYLIELNEGKGKIATFRVVIEQ